MKRAILPAILLSAVLFCHFADARIQRVTKIVTASTNAAATAHSGNILAVGVISRIVIQTSAGGTAAVKYVDIDGTVLLNLTNLTGTTTITNYQTPTATITLYTYLASATNVAVTNSIEYDY